MSYNFHKGSVNYEQLTDIREDDTCRNFLEVLKSENSENFRKFVFCFVMTIFKITVYYNIFQDIALGQNIIGFPTTTKLVQ